MTGKNLAPDIPLSLFLRDTAYQAVYPGSGIGLMRLCVSSVCRGIVRVCCNAAQRVSQLVGFGAGIQEELSA